VREPPYLGIISVTDQPHLADIKGLPRLPYIKDVLTNATLNASNIQCDILCALTFIVVILPLY